MPSIPPISTDLINKQKKIDSLYCLKALSSFFVVLIHSECWQKQWLDFIVGTGTPCFLTITGYLLYSGDCAKELAKCIKWAKKLFRLAITCMLIYLAFYCPLVGATWTWKTIIANIITGDRICFVLWYLTALWEALLLLWLIRKYLPKLISWLPLILIITYILRVHPDLITLNIPPRFSLLLRNNAVITSLPFLSVGYLIHKHKAWLLENVNVNIWLPAILILSFIETQARIKFGLPHDLFGFFSFPCIALLMLACVRHPGFKIPVLNQIGERHSANIYYFHMFVLAILRYHLNIYSPFEAFLVWFCCIPLSIVFNFVTERFSDTMKKLSHAWTS